MPRGRSLRLRSTMRLISRADRAQVAALHGAVDVQHAADVVVIDHAPSGAARDAGDIAQDLRLAIGLGR